MLVDALITKATAGGEPGELVEAGILLEGAMDLADRHALGFSAEVRGPQQPGPPVLRTRSAAGRRAGSDPRGIRPHRYHAGNDASALFVISGLSFIYQRMLDLEAIEQLLTEPILADPPGNTVSALLEPRGFLAWVRGDTAQAVALLAEAADLLEGEADPQLAALRANQLGTISRLTGNAEEAFASAMAWGGRAGASSSGSTTPSGVWPSWETVNGPPSSST